MSAQHLLGIGLHHCQTLALQARGIGSTWELVRRPCPRPTKSWSVVKWHCQVICPLNLGSTTLCNIKNSSALFLQKKYGYIFRNSNLWEYLFFFVFPESKLFSQASLGSVFHLTFMEDPAGIWNMRAQSVCDSQTGHVFSGRHCIVSLMYTFLKFLLLLSNYNQLYFFF